MKEIRVAKNKFAKEKKQTLKKINENFMASQESTQRQAPTEPAADEQHTMKEFYNFWLYQNTMAMFSPYQQGKIYDILILAKKLPEDIRKWDHFSSKIFQVQI
jgi:hypothetical protein